MKRRRFFETALSLVSYGAILMHSTLTLAHDEPANPTDRAYRESEHRLLVHGVEIPCRLSIPTARAKGLLLLLPGSLYSDVDGNYPSMNLRPHLYADLAQQLAERRWIVLRMAKIGPGTGSRVVDEAASLVHADFLTRVEVARVALELLLRQRSESDVVGVRAPLLVAGHSEGALVAALLAQTASGAELDGVVSLSGPAERLLDLLRAQMFGMSPPGVDLASLDLTIAAIRAGETPPDATRQHPQSAMLANMGERAHQYLRSVDRVDPRVEYSRVRQPVLLIQGGRDGSVPSAHAEQLRTARADLPTVKHEFEALTHFYKVAPADLPPMQSMALESTSDPQVAAALDAWALGLAKAQHTGESSARPQKPMD